jgi:hypothetical protein
MKNLKDTLTNWFAVILVVATAIKAYLDSTTGILTGINWGWRLLLQLLPGLPGRLLMVQRKVLQELTKETRN